MKKTSTKKRGFITGLIAMVLVIMMVAPMLLNTTSFAAPKKTPGYVKLTSISAPAYNKVKINWKKTSNATHYKIYYRKTGTKKWIGVKTLNNKYSSYTHKSSKSKPIIVGQKYDYTVKAYNSKSKKSGKYNKKGLITWTRPNEAKLEKVALNSSKDKVTISWKKAGGADKYFVFRKTSTSDWERLSSNAINGNVFKYVDKNPIKGKTNYYTVKSYYSKTISYGNYNDSGLSVFVPKNTSTNKPNSSPEPSKPIMVESIDIGPLNPSVRIGESIKLTANVYPSNATNKDVIWENDSPDILKMVVHGNSVTVTGLDWGEGEISVSAKDSGKPMDFITVKVGSGNVSGNENEDLDADAMARRVGELTNEVRRKYNTKPLIYHEKLHQAAMLRAKEIATYFSHVRPDGSNSSQIGALVGAGNITGENIARGQRTPKDVVNAWEKSPGHLIGMCYKYDTHMGAGCYKDSNGMIYWVQLFGGDPDIMCTITFDPTGGRFDTLGGIMKYEVQTPSGQCIYMKDIPKPVKDGYIFDGWIDEYGTKHKYRATTCTMYATWIKQ